MKKFRNTSWYAAALVAVSMSGCSKQLEEYNPGGATADGIWNNPKNFVTAVNSAYWAQRYWYGKEDGVFLSETGTDIWINTVNKSTYGRQVSKYDGMAGGVGYVKSTWKWLWASINQCNAGIGRIDGAGFTDEAEKNRRLGELRFLRAFYYWHIVETWGNVMLRTTETSEFENTATRAQIKDFYDLMISDLEFAKENLPNSWGEEYSRATKKSALGMLARVYLSRGYYPDADANAMFSKARDIAKEVIARQAEFGVSMYPTPADLWKPANNKRNKEALYIISNSTKSITYNYDKDGNKEHMYFLANYYEKPGMKQTNEYGRAESRLLMPTRYLLELFGANDKRYDASFQEQWYNNVDTNFRWTPENWKIHGAKNNKDSLTMVTGGPGGGPMTIDAKALSLVISRTPMANKNKLNYVAFDINDIYDANGVIIDKFSNFPSFKKFMDPNRPVEISSQAGFNDIQVIRLAEMYAIAGEAEYKLGNADAAATHFNVLRTRAGADQITGATITPIWILEERAREFCGEHIRWFDVKRILRGDEWANHIKNKNPNISLIKGFHWLRPVSQDEINGLLNAAEFGQNTGYPLQ